MSQQSAKITVVKANDVEIIKDWLDDHIEFFNCDCDAYQESDTGAWIHNENECSAFMSDHVDITLTRLIEWLLENGPLHIRS